MPIPGGGNAFAAVAIRLAVLLATGEHITVLSDAMAVGGRDSVFSVDGLALRGGPGEVISSDLNIIVGEFSELVIIHTQEFGLFRSTEMKTWNKVDTVGEYGGHDEGVGGGGNDVGNLDVHLLVILIEEASVDDTSVYTIETDDVGCTEHRVEEETDHTGDTVLSEHVEGVIDFDPKFDYGELVG